MPTSISTSSLHVRQAMLAIGQPDCGSVQIIFNMLRTRPSASFLAAAKAAGVGTLLRLPFASGLLTGKVTPEYVAGLADGDHRKFNVGGAAFDKGETWSGLGEDLEGTALPAVDEIKAIHAGALERGELAAGTTLGMMALRWILDHEGASAVIPGARSVEQVVGNLGACGVPALSPAVHAAAKRVYESRVKAVVEAERW